MTDCKHCGGPIEIANPTGKCNHIYWPDNLTDEAKEANGYIKKTIVVWEKKMTPNDLDVCRKALKL
jgi:hypothetical protein